MSDLIRRQAAIDALCSVCGVDCDKSKFVYDGKQEDQVILCPEHYVLTQLPSAQPQRMRGEWIDVTKTGGAELWKCSECGELELEDSYFCPNCGSDMRED